MSAARRRPVLRTCRDPALVWLRKLVLAINEARELDRAMTATDLYELCESAQIGIPGLSWGADEDKGKKLIGTIMAKLFRDGDTIEVDAFNVTREERDVARANTSAGGSFKSKTYKVSEVSPNELLMDDERAILGPVAPFPPDGGAVSWADRILGQAGQFRLTIPAHG